MRGAAIAAAASALVTNTNDSGGGIALFGGTSLSISNSVLTSNTSSAGAAIDIFTGTVQIVDSPVGLNREDAKAFYVFPFVPQQTGFAPLRFAVKSFQPPAGGRMPAV